VAIGSLDNPIQAIDDILVKISADNIQETVARLEDVYHRFDGNQEMDFRFLDAMVHEHYRSEQVFRKVFGLASGLAIYIACLGLIGLAAFSAERRVREFGIRRVLGASATRIVHLQVAEFLKLVTIANLIAWPIAWFVADGWLRDFSYRIAVKWDVLVLSGILVASIAVVTVGAIALRATRVNPLESLRSQ
jgi:putative ABC transport system permease protein